MRLVKAGEEIIRKRNVRAVVFLSRKGLISLSSGAVERMGLAAGEGIVFWQDADSPEDWYIGKDAEGLKLRDARKRLAANASGLTRAIMDSLHISEESVSIPLGNEPIRSGGVECYALITSAVFGK